MGEVYRARDTKLGREVAIKVLPTELAHDRDRLDRFEREAKLLASLNHGNIATLHGFEESNGQRFLIMELVEGETLADRIAGGSIPIDEVVGLFQQIAQGLEAAHEKGVIHRDLKPANIKITPDGTVKILDFGLAKAFPPEVNSSPDRSKSPTLTRGTGFGAIMGTASYMSPEQARGQIVDKRSDIWAFGCCLYEALAGKRAFDGATVTDILAAIIERDPRLDELPEAVPGSVRRLLRRCLRKEPRERLHDIADARLDLEESKADDLVVGKPRVGRRAFGVIALALGALGYVGFRLWSSSSGEAPRVVTRSVLPAPGAIGLGLTSSLAISPDGRRIAFVVEEEAGGRRIYLRNLDDLEAKPVAGTEEGEMPFFSPDGGWLGFKSANSVMKVSLRGGAPVRITGVSMARGPVARRSGAATGMETRGVSWGSNGVVLSASVADGFASVSADGELQKLTSPRREQREKSHRWPHVLPDGKGVLFTLGSGDIHTFDDASIAVFRFETGEYRVVLEGGMDARYIATGHLVYARDGTLLAAPFDLNELRVTGVPVPVLEGVRSAPRWGHAEYDVSEGGTLVYVPGRAWGDDYRVVWVNRRGEKTPILDVRGGYLAPRLSPDGRMLALDRDGANVRLEIFDLQRETLTPLVSGFDNAYPVWSPASDRLAFMSTREGAFNLFTVRADGSSPVERLTTSEQNQNTSSWIGEDLAFTETHPETGDDIWILSMTGDRTPRPFLRNEANELAPAISPDGRWIAYTSDESGREEVYILPMEGTGGRRQVSTAGGSVPRWRADGRELFYVQGNRMTAVETRMDDELGLGLPRTLFELSQGLISLYDVTPDGERFVMVDATESEPPPHEIILVQNWFEEVRRLVRADN
jgi:serine/threonine-protein kinase